MKRAGVLVVALATGVGACSDARADGATWYLVARDANYDVYIDPARIRQTIGPSEKSFMPAFEVWYRTDHKRSRLHDGKVFNREVVRSLVQCDSLWFKVERDAMSMGDERPIALQEATWEELARQPWRRIRAGTLDDAAARIACELGARSRRH